MPDDARRPDTGAAPSTERRFYANTRAFGRFGMRLFEPKIMEAPHWHGHIEANFLIHARMSYDVDGDPIEVPEGRLVLFWAGTPHRLTSIARTDPEPAKLCNIYIPLDAFLFMPHIARLQVSLLSGAMVMLPVALCDYPMIERWYADYRSGDFERTDLIKMDLNALFRRGLLSDQEFLRTPTTTLGSDREISSAHIRHVVDMVRFILDHLDRPLRNAEVTKVTGLHENYALSIFSRTMKLPLKQFVIRMRLLRARALLTESAMPITLVAEASGFTSISQFYHLFKTAYGLPPQTVRNNYVRMALR
jgi:AraC family transcriptional regulator, melibiose operon regulatory protein